MATSLISNSHHIDFDSVFGIYDTGLVQMFETLIATGLKEFLGCPVVFYEAALSEFFEISSVRDGVMVSTIKGTTIEISENIFATNFGLPTEGLTDFSEVPKDLVFDARSLFSVSKEQVSISCLKKEMKIQYRLLSGILAKTLYVKAGSFDVVTRVLGQLDSVTTTDSGDQPVGTDAETIPWFDLPCVLATRDFERLFETASDSEDDMDPDVEVPMELDQQPFLSSTSSAPDMNFDETYITATLPSLPALSTDLSASFDDLQISLSARLDESQSDILSKLHTIEKGLRDSLQQQEEAFRTLIQVRELNAKVDVVSTRLDDVKKDVEATKEAISHQLLDFQAQAQANHNILTGQLSELVNYINRGGNDKKGEVRELNAKVDVVSTRLDDVKKDVEATKEAISHQLLDFQAQAQANHNILTGQLSELVNYINRGGNDKKGEGSSRGPQPPPDDQNRDSVNAGGDTARSIVERLISADRERERSRGNRSESYKRRRY
ncbi:hypothetical protein F511_29843 [Dorcoceras hygrometricum]|uniref:Dystroglycan-like n=1 Tax=Dorcoceras hygrometricum TaxID=472368 RepID=A0A2Z7D9S2_9LAMI|nr:hypothetical protein F511_29843 [Dorcoceras hygrometricum]